MSHLPPLPGRLLALLLTLVGLPSCCLLSSGPPRYPAQGLESGLRFRDKAIPETGPQIELNDTITVHYEMRLEDGTEVDSSLDRATPITFTVGAGMVPEGFDEGVRGMRRFGRRKLVLPPHLAFGEEGRPPLIPPDAKLIILVEVLEIEGKGDD
jgi:FKBP-type peptidyl-prolyl cis-trans isomerase